MSQFSFGSGNAFAVPQSGLADLTPVGFGTLQDVSVDFKFTTKDLMGQNQFPVAVARASGKVTGKIKAANFSAREFNLVFGSTITNTGQTNVSVVEASAVPANSPYTATAANAATFAVDLGVLYAATGKAFAKVASAPTVGQYAVSSSGVYTFAAADTGAALLLNYTYTSATGNTLAITNQVAGTQPVVSLTLSEGLNGVYTGLTLNSVIFNSLSLDFKNEDFTVPELDFEAFANAAGQVGQFSLASA